ncbi:MAG: type II toxin-antitoxin system VapC family toxin [Solirubrobacterales bacterium]
MAIALDSNVVIGFLDRGDALHEASDVRVRQLLDGGENLVASTITYAEVLTGARLGHHDEDVVRGFFRELISEVMPIELEAAERAAELRGDTPALKMPDALILAGADVHPDVERIVCADELAARVGGMLLNCDVERLTDGA